MPVRTAPYREPAIKSLLSFQPLVMSLKRMIAEDKPGAKKLYGELVRSLENAPELMQPIDEEVTLNKHEELIDTLCATIFPPTDSKKESMYAVTHPFGLQIVYASTPFEKLFVKPGSDLIHLQGEDKVREKISRASKQLAYNLILQKFYKSNTSEYTSFVFTFNDLELGMKKLEAWLDARFIVVKKINGEMNLPEKSEVLSATPEDLPKLLPLDEFVFEGVLIIDISDVTEREVISEIKNILIKLNSFSDASVYESLQVHIQTLLGLKDIRIGITPFFKVNGYYLFNGNHVKNSMLFRGIHSTKQKIRVSKFCQEYFKDRNQPALFDVDSEHNGLTEIKNIYENEGYKNLLIYPLKKNSLVIGLLEIASKEPDVIKGEHITKAEPAISLFSLALEKSKETLEIEIDRKIKENFTAIQNVVEWKFTEAAFQYLQAKQQNENAKIPPIIFDNVYPLYGAIDIRNSSVERSKAIQLDLVDQLKMVKKVLNSIREKDQFPLLREIIFKVEKYLKLPPDQWLSEDEVLIHDFLQYEVASLLYNLKKNMPDLEGNIALYLQSLDPERKMIYNQRKRYEESIAIINDRLAHFVDEEQDAAQKVFPHYFERYVTDGVEFNIYIGQSLAPQFQFDEIYVRNLKMWQFQLLAKAARLIRGIEKDLPLKMQTTQLILANSSPISISFRSKERKFDVDGSYNMRHEIIKKRIDKVHIKDSEERLTQPGTIAIVYSQQKEREEYLEYIDFMKAEGLIMDEVEEFQLEDLQGISGMSAIRVNVKYD